VSHCLAFAFCEESFLFCLLPGGAINSMHNTLMRAVEKVKGTTFTVILPMDLEKKLGEN